MTDKQYVIREPTKAMITIKNVENTTIDITINEDWTYTEAAQKFFQELKAISLQAIPEEEFCAYYRNWRGEIAWRILIPKGIWYGKTEWHPQEQWFLKAEDTRDGKIKDFALCDFLGETDPAEPKL